MTTTPSCAVSSNSFTMSCPRRALVGQWTRRSDSPCSCSRTEWKSKPCRAPKEQPPPVSASPPGVAEETVELDEPRPHDDRRGIARDRRRHRDEAEQVAERDLRIGDPEDASRQPVEVEFAARHAACRAFSRQLRVPSRPSVARTVIEPSSSLDVRRTSTATRTRSPSVAGAGVIAYVTVAGLSANQVQSQVRPDASRKADADHAERARDRSATAAA